MWTQVQKAVAGDEEAAEVESVEKFVEPAALDFQKSDGTSEYLQKYDSEKV